MRLACARQLALVRSKQNELWIDRFDGARDSIGQFLVAHGHVIKSTVRFDVVRLHAHGGSNRLKNAELISDGVEYFQSTYFQFFTSEILAIEKTWMRSDGDAVLRSEEHTSELQSQSNLVCR